MNLRKNLRGMDFVITAVNVLFFLGIRFIFHSCPAKADGSFMTCHYAQNVVLFSLCVLALISLVNIFVNAQIKKGLLISCIILALASVLIPGHLVALCHSAQMRCHMITKPFSMLFLFLSAFLSAVNLLFVILRQKKNEIHK